MDWSRCHNRRVFNEAMVKDSVEGIAVPSLTGMPPPPRLGTHGGTDIAYWCNGEYNGGCCIQGVHALCTNGTCKYSSPELGELGLLGCR